MDELTRIYGAITKAVLDETGIDITDTRPETYIPAILQAIRSLQSKACSCKEGKGCI